MSIILRPKRWTGKPPVGTQLMRGHPLATGLVGCWIVNEQAGLSVYDLAQGYTASISGPTWNSAGVRINAVSDLVTATAVPYNPEFTAVARIQRLGNLANIFRSVMSHHTTSSVPSDWFIYASNSGTINIDIPWVASNVLVGVRSIADTLPHQIAVTRTGSTGAWTYKIYIDGVLDKTGSTAFDPATTAQTLGLGCLVGNTYGMDGIFRSGAYYSRALSAGEIQQLYQDPFCFLQPQRGRRYFVGSTAAPTNPANVIGGQIAGGAFVY